MPSSIAWLDTSSEEQRRAREIIALFAQPESRDELGIGQIRDAFSDTLFPGTSVIQTRARYFLFVPWIYRDGLRRGFGGQQLKAWADIRERRLVEVLRAVGATDGLIGRVAGPAVKILPSAIYWSGLSRFGILTGNVAADHLAASEAARAISGVDELADRQVGAWYPTLPEPPDGFPAEVEDGFSLTTDEARWLAERIVTAAPGTMLSHIVQRNSVPDADSWAPWAGAACADAPVDLREWLEHARLFSLGMHGAALLYNLLIGEQYEAADHSRIKGPISDYRKRLASWHKGCRDSSREFSRWDRPAMWEQVTKANPRITVGTRSFVDAWLDAVVSGEAEKAADNPILRTLVRQRELRQKMSQSRLTNARLLRTWSGEAGSARLTYRWAIVRRLITDIHEGVMAGAGA